MVDQLADYGEAKALADRLKKVSRKNPGMTLTSENIELIKQELNQERILADL